MPTQPPSTRRVDVADDYHGTLVADPYRWLEDGDDPEVVEWVEAQNAVTRRVLDRDPARARWHRRLVELMRLPVVQDARLAGEHVFCWERPAGAEQAVLARRSASDADAPPVVLLDPAVLSDDAATAIDWFHPSADGARVAVGTSEGGTERSTLRIIAGADGADAGAPGDEIPDTRACSIAWEPDGSGFFYTRYPAGDEYHRTVHHHRLGDDWRDDPVVWAEHPDPQAWPAVELSDDGRWLLVEVMVGWSRMDVHLLDRASDTWTTVVAGVEANTYLRFAAAGASLVGLTTVDAGRGRVVRVPLPLDAESVATLAAGPGSWETLVPERDDVIKAVDVCADGLLMVTTSAAVDSLWRLDHDGAPRADGPVELGGIVTVEAGTTSTAATASFVVASSFGAPPALWRIDGDEVRRWCPDPPPAEAVPDLTVTQTSYRSLDGTEIGLFLIHRADVEPGADTPTILYAYGGFTIALGPAFQPRLAAWCAAGGLFAVAGLRGGSEHGEEWHEAGMRANKQNVFDDFHAAADHLVATGLTSRQRLAIFGGSNGGLLMGAAITQRPDLCGAVVCAVPLLDMIRFPQFLIAKLWTAEYGDPDVAEEFEWLHAYSPYHRVVEGTAYPPTLIQTAEGDSRVDPCHARKMTAMLQWATDRGADSAAGDERDGGGPVLLFQEGRAGHGVGKPVAKQADSVADALTFLGSRVGLEP